jgi:hypothetical protein
MTLMNKGKCSCAKPRTNSLESREHIIPLPVNLSHLQGVILIQVNVTIKVIPVLMYLSIMP